MKVFVDNTTVHNVFKIIKMPSSTPIRISDIFALLHFVEHILFSENMEISTFESSYIQETTEQAIDFLLDNGCIDGLDKSSLLSVVDFTEEQYANACIDAAPKIQEDLQILDYEILTKASRMADIRTQPSGVKDSAIQKWLVKDWNEQERRRIEDNALSKKARGAYDYTIASNEVLYHQLQILRSKLKRQKQIKQIAFFVDVFFRLAINQELARQRNRIYSPAPQRAATVNKSDELFRYAVLSKIENHIRNTRGQFPSRLLEQIQEKEVLPLPMFAIHFLRNEDFDSPMGMLQAARKLRDQSEIRYLRSWLSKWEESYNSSDTRDRQRVSDHLDRIALDLQIERERVPLFSILRGEVSQSLDGSINLGLDFSGVEDIIKHLLIRFSRRRIFLASLRREFEFDDTIGTDIIKKLNRALDG